MLVTCSVLHFHFRMVCKTSIFSIGMRSLYHIAALMLLFLGLGGCQKEVEKQSAALDPSFAATSLSFIKSIQASNEANQLRSADYSAPFEISKVERNKELLAITVTYPEGCNDSKFSLIWNGLTLESYPEIIFLYLRRTTGCSTTGSTTTRTLTINLATSLGDAALAQRVKIILCNGSKKANTENSDITVSSN